MSNPKAQDKTLLVGEDARRWYDWGEIRERVKSSRWGSNSAEVAGLMGYCKALAFILSDMGNQRGLKQRRDMIWLTLNILKCTVFDYFDLKLFFITRIIAHGQKKLTFKWMSALRTENRTGLGIAVEGKGVDELG